MHCGERCGGQVHTGKLVRGWRHTASRRDPRHTTEALMFNIERKCSSFSRAVLSCTALAIIFHTCLCSGVLGLVSAFGGLARVTLADEAAEGVVRDELLVVQLEARRRRGVVGLEPLLDGAALVRY